MKNEDEDKLLEVLSDKQFADAPLREVIKHLYFQVIQSQVLETKLRSELAKTNKKLSRVEDALSSIMFIRSGFLKLRYNNRTSEVTVEKYYRIDFGNTIENDLLKTMFYQKSGRPRPAKWQCSEVAEIFSKKGNDIKVTPYFDIKVTPYFDMNSCIISLCRQSILSKCMWPTTTITFLTAGGI